MGVFTVHRGSREGSLAALPGGDQNVRADQRLAGARADAARKSRFHGERRGPAQVPGAVSDANEVRSRARTLEQQAKRLEPKLAAAASKGQKLAVTAAAAQNPEGLPPK